MSRKNNAAPSLSPSKPLSVDSDADVEKQTAIGIHQIDIHNAGRGVGLVPMVKRRKALVAGKAVLHQEGALIQRGVDGKAVAGKIGLNCIIIIIIACDAAQTSVGDSPKIVCDPYPSFVTIGAFRTLGISSAGRKAQTQQ